MLRSGQQCFLMNNVLVSNQKAVDNHELIVAQLLKDGLIMVGKSQRFGHTMLVDS